MKKKLFLASILTVLLSFSIGISSFAVDLNQTSILQILSALEIMNGDANGSLNLDKTVTRAEFTKMAVNASVYKDSAKSSATIAPYPDVTAEHWASGYVQTAKSTSLINGYLDGTFRPNNTVKLEEAVTILLKLLGYSSSDFTGAYPDSQMALYKTLKMDKNISVATGEELTRRDCANLIYNTLIARAKSGTVYAASIGCPLDSNGNVDYLELLNALIDGPVTADGTDVSSLVGFTPVKVYKNDKLSSVSEINPYDILFYVKETGSVWAYDTKVSGKLDSISPSMTSPSSVTVNGVVYSLDTQSAIMSVSSIGTFKEGDAVTLLIGRNKNSVCEIISANLVSNDIYGIVTAVGASGYTDASGSEYFAGNISVTATDGSTYTYPCTERSIEEGTLVSIKFDANGISIERLYENKSVSGKVNSSATKIGNYTIADDAEILDYYENLAVAIKPERIKGLSLNSDNVYFCHFNQNGEISRLILKNVTGDMFSYGILTNVQEYSTPASVQGVYTFLSGGAERMLSSSSIFGAEGGPCRMIIQNGAISSIKSLTKVSLSSVSELSAKSSSKAYTLSDNVQIYEVKDGKYYTSTVSRIQQFENCSINGYYDKDESDGGRIRIIVVKEL